MSDNWGRVAETVKRRRTALELSQRAAADRARISPTTWNQFELKQEPISDLTRAAMSKALLWTPDSIDRVLRGDEPVEDPDARVLTTEERLAALEAAVEALTELVRRRKP